MGVMGRLDWRALTADSQPPSWLVELEMRRTHGEFLGVATQRVARFAGVSREHLSRSYGRFFGTTIADALRARQLRASYDAVIGSDRPLADIAADCGFADQSHLTRAFGAWIGVTPGALRRRPPRITPVQDARPATRV
jgi:AraC family transcriptional regulator